MDPDGGYRDWWGHILPSGTSTSLKASFSSLVRRESPDFSAIGHRTATRIKSMKVLVSLGKQRVMVPREDQLAWARTLPVFVQMLSIHFSPPTP